MPVIDGHSVGIEHTQYFVDDGLTSGLDLFI